MGSRDTSRDTPLGSNRLIPVTNGSGAAIPMGGIVWLNGESGGAMSADQPDSDTHPWFVAQTAIGNGARGVVSCDFPLWAAYDTGEATPAVGDEIGPENGSFYLVPTGTGFVAITAGADGLVLVMGVAATTSSGSGGVIVASLPSALTQAQATKASCVVVETFSGGPAVSSTVTCRNPVTSVGGTYFWRAANGFHVVAVYNGTDYTIVNVQHTVQQFLEDTDWATPNFTQDRKDALLPGIDNSATDTILTGDTSCPEP